MATLVDYPISNTNGYDHLEIYEEVTLTPQTYNALITATSVPDGKVATATIDLTLTCRPDYQVAALANYQHTYIVDPPISVPIVVTHDTTPCPEADSWYYCIKKSGSNCQTTILSSITVDASGIITID